MTRSTWLWPAIIIGSAVAVSAVVLGDLSSPIRPVLVLWFLLVCPGLAFVRLLRIKDLGNELTLAIALSLAIDSILAMVMIYAKLWSPKGGLSVLISLCVIGVMLQIRVMYRHAHGPERG